MVKIGALNEASPSRFVLLVFGSKTMKENRDTSGTEIQCRFGNPDICLNFCKRIGPLRDGRESIFVIIFLFEFISDQAVRLAFSNFREIVSVTRI